MAELTRKPMAPVADDAAHLLVVDDDTRIRSLLSRYLGEHGYRVTTAGDAAEARRKIEGLDFDLLIVDVMMPGETGLQLTKSLRTDKQVPILMLTALSDTDDRIAGLMAGADDYLSKPFDPRELMLRIDNILKRARVALVEPPKTVRFGPFTFDIERRELKRDDEMIRLTEREQDLMVEFAKASGGTVSRYDLADGASTVGERTIDVQINRLRRKIEVDPSNPVYLQTVRGIGYRLMPG